MATVLATMKSDLQGEGTLVAAEAGNLASLASRVIIGNPGGSLVADASLAMGRRMAAQPREGALAEVEAAVVEQSDGDRQRRMEMRRRTLRQMRRGRNSAARRS